MLERIQKIISAAGVTSRRAAEQLITEGRVRVNGQVVTELGVKADASKDHIKVDGKLINPRQPLTYLMLNKPAGFVTTMSDPEGRPTVQDLLKGVKVRVYPVGRLDYNTEGMLILTNDGDFAHLITHPKHELPKTYLAKLKGVLDEKAIESLEQGVFLEDGKTAPAKLKKVRKEEANSWVEITIHEGRKRQVRRMFDRVGRSVIKLKRIKTGSLVLGDLPEGTFRYLTPAEVAVLREMAQNPGVMIPMPEARKKAEPESVIKSQEATGGDFRRAASTRRQRPGEGRVRGTAMQDTGAGRRKNQVVRPRTRTDYPGTMRPGGTAGWGSRSNNAYSPTSRPAASRPTMRTGSNRPAPGAGMGRPEVKRKPDQRPWPSTRKSDPRSERLGAVPGYRPRKDSSARPATRFAASRPATRAGIGRSASGAVSGRPETMRKPGPRSWSGAGSSDSGNKSSGYGQQRDGARRPGSGPRPNRGAHTGSKGPGRGTKFGGRGAGRKK